MKPLILVVEDELIVAMDIKEILEAEGYQCIINITSVDEAILQIEQSKPALVLIDINLRESKDGVHLAEYLLVKDSIPFVYITSYSDKAALERVKATRPYGLIVKPFRPVDLITTVAIVLNNQLHSNIDVLRSQDPITVDLPFIIKKVVKYIDDNVNDKITISDLAQLTRWKSQHFQKIFTEYVGITPHKYIIKRKIAVAKSLLEESDIPIVQISFYLGFKSHSNFCSVFKKLENKTPESFKKRCQANKYLATSVPASIK